MAKRTLSTSWMRWLDSAMDANRQELLVAKVVDHLCSTTLRNVWRCWTGVVGASITHRHNVYRVLRHMRLLVLESCFALWRDKTVDTSRLNQLLERSAARVMSGTTSRVFCAWLTHISDVRRVEEIAANVVARLATVKQRVALRQWVAAVHDLHRQRHVLDRTFRRNESVLLSVSLATWRERTTVKLRRCNLLRRATNRMASRCVACALHAWIEFASHSKRLQAVYTLVLTRVRYRALNVAWEQWIRFIAKVHASGIQTLMGTIATPVPVLSSTPARRQRSTSSQRKAAAAAASPPRYRAAQRPLFLDSLSPQAAAFSTDTERSQQRGPAYSYADDRLRLLHSRSASPQAPDRTLDRTEDAPIRHGRWEPIVSQFVALTVFFLCSLLFLEAMVQQDLEPQGESSSTTATATLGTHEADENAPEALRGAAGSGGLTSLISAEDLVSLTIVVPSLMFLMRSCCAINDSTPSATARLTETPRALCVAAPSHTPHAVARYGAV